MYEGIKEKLIKARSVVFFTGAGISTESGIPDFRSADGLYSENEFKGYSPEQILSRSFFYRHTDIFYRYYFSKIVHRNARPNSGHTAIADIEKKGYQVTVITQNIDGLHTEAGSKNVIEVHGSVLENYCTDCRKRYKLDQIIEKEGAVPVCDLCGGVIRPDVTLYEEALDMDSLARSVSRISDADALFAIGSSLTVQPAAGLLDYFKGDLFVIINKDSTYYDRKADFVINSGCGAVLEDIAGGLNG